MKKSEAKKLVQEGKAQIYNDAPEKLEVLKEVTDYTWVGSDDYYTKDFCGIRPAPNLQIINLSEIKDDEVQWQYSDDGRIWNDANRNRQYRIKPAVDLQPYIDELKAKAKEAGTEVVITFEKQ